MAKLFMLVGPSGSGKSTWAAANLNTPGMFTEIYSSDMYREKLFGDVNDQTHNSEVFNQLHKDMLEALENNIDICYDATNLTKKDRWKFLQKLNLNIKKIAVVFKINPDIINEQNRARARIVPDNVILRQLNKFNYNNIINEGFDQIILIER